MMLVILLGLLHLNNVSGSCLRQASDFYSSPSKVAYNHTNSTINTNSSPWENYDTHRQSKVNANIVSLIVLLSVVGLCHGTQSRELSRRTWFSQSCPQATLMHIRRQY